MACALAAMVGLTACGGGSSSTRFLPSLLVPPVSPVPPDPPESPDGSSKRKWGYIALPDGNKLRYAVLLPEGTGPFPVLIEYDGYSAGSTPTPEVGEPWVKEGYAVMGLSVPGTGCSTGDDQWVDESTGAAGAFAVEWAAKQPWSTGNVGMVGYSYSGYNQLWVASQRPPSLKAIMPSKNVADPYRDVGYPGGIQNIGFPSHWWGGFPDTWQDAAKVANEKDGDTECEKTVAENIEKIKRPELDLMRWLNEDHFFGARYAKKSAMYLTSKIDIPTLGTQAWQDEAIGPRAGYYEDTISPEKMWLISSNGTHSTDFSAFTRDTMKRFYAHFLKGEANGFERGPHVMLPQEMQLTGEDEASLVPTAVATFDRLPVPVKPMSLWLQPGGLLSDAAPTGVEDSASYRYPVESPAANKPRLQVFEATTAKDGRLSFTTAALPQALSFYGEGSADLWLSATVRDTDVQVTLSEVRPDGREMFIQRGWLRASMRALDPARTTSLRPWGDFTEAAVLPLVAGEPALMRMEIRKFAHVFRAGSGIRLTIDTPSQTGAWIFGNLKTPSTNTVWFDKTRPSKLVLGYVLYEHADALPSCTRTLLQACRANEEPLPAGTGPRAPT